MVLPKRFDLTYVTASGAREHPVMLHRALFGSLERFLGILLEQHGAQLPGWLAPVQAHVLPVTAQQLPAAEAFHARLLQRGLRAELPGDDSLARRIAQAHTRAVPYIAIIGAASSSCSAHRAPWTS